MHARLSLTLLTFAALAFAACQSAPPGGGGRIVEDIGDPDAAVADIRDDYAATPSDGFYRSYETGKGHKLPSRAVLRRRSENLLFSHPDHVDGRMAAALLAYQAQDPAEAARHLDYLLRIDPGEADAALLRARIALEQGNAPLARRLLDQQVALNPDHAGLREAHASALFLDGAYDQAAEALEEAGRLGADAGRIAYNRGLVCEATGDLQMAVRHYRHAVELKPGWDLPAERLRGLEVRLPRDLVGPPPTPAPAPKAAPKPAPAPAPKAPTPAEHAPDETPAPAAGPETIVSFPPPAPRKPDRCTPQGG